MPDFGLRELQSWMLDAVTHPEGVLAAELGSGNRPAIEEVIHETPELSPSESLSIYANMYFWRLIDILGEEYDVLRAVLGSDAFHELAKAYLVQCPSRNYSLSKLGPALPGYIAEHFEHPNQAMLADLARLEWAIEVVFDERQAPPLSLPELLAIPGEAWPDAYFDPVPALRLLALEHPVNDLYQAIRDKVEWTNPPKQEAWTVIFRRDYVVWRSDIDRERFVLLDALFSGLTLGDAIEACAALPGVDAEDLTASLGPWFKDWTSDGFFQRIRV
jgi:hypothetical protein